MKRIFWIDFGKGFGIFLVVLAHVLANIANNVVLKNDVSTEIIHFIMYVLFLIIMPIFFAMSGYLFKIPLTYKKYALMLRKKIIILGIPYLFFSLLLFIMSFFLKIDVEGINGIKSLILIPIYPISYLWFLNALFFCYLVVGFCEVKKINSFVQYIIYIVATILSFMLPSTNVWYYFVSNFSWILCFYIGFQLKEKKLFINKSVIVISLFLFVISAFIQIKTSSLWYLQGDFFTYSNFLAKISSIFILIPLFKTVKNTNKIARYFEKYGKISLIIYLVHVPIISVLRKCLVKFGVTNIWLLFLLLLIFSWYISIVVSRVFNKVKPLDLIFYPKRYIRNI